MESHSSAYCFDPEAYVERYYSGHYPNKVEERIVEWMKENIHNIFAEGKYRGKRLLDVGSGPVIYAVITASKYFDEVYVSDVSEANVEYLQKWIRGESEQMTYLMKQYAAMDGDGVTWQEKNNQVRKKIKNAIVFDMHNTDMLSGTMLDGTTFDAITASLCMGASNPDGIDSFSLSLKNFRKLLNPGGHLIIVDVMKCDWYAVHDKVFRILSITEEDLKLAFENLGFKIEELKTEEVGDYPDSERTTSDARSFYSIVAKKM